MMYAYSVNTSKWRIGSRQDRHAHRLQLSYRFLCHAVTAKAVRAAASQLRPVGRRKVGRKVRVVDQRLARSLATQVFQHGERRNRKDMGGSGQLSKRGIRNLIHEQVCQAIDPCLDSITSI